MDTLVAPPPTETVLSWRANPGPQEFALQQPYTVFEILYGGARGGGKTDAGMAWLSEYVEHPKYRALVLRRNAEDLSDWIDRAQYMFSGLGAKLTRHPTTTFTFPSGAKIRCGHLKDKDAFTKYQGHEYQKILIEELTQIPKENHYQTLLYSCRSSVPELRPQVFLTTNPGGVGHGWVKRRFIQDRNQPPRIPCIPFLNSKTGRKAIFIPASIDDNPILTTNDPEYVMQLEALKESDEQLYKAWRLGSWDVFIGQAFPEFNVLTHVYPSQKVPMLDKETLAKSLKITCFDWGYTAMGVMLWLAVSPVENEYGVRHVWCYRELAQNMKSPKMWGVDLAKAFKEEERLGHGRPHYMALPHDCFGTTRGEQTIASTFQAITGLSVQRMPTLNKGARTNRKALLHSMLQNSEDGSPYLLFNQSVNYTIDTIPELVYDDNNPEDINTDGEDHGYDALTGGLLTLSMDPVASGAVKHHQPRDRLDKKRTFVATPDGEYVAPDIMSAVGNAKKRRSSPY